MVVEAAPRLTLIVRKQKPFRYDLKQGNSQEGREDHAGVLGSSQ